MKYIIISVILSIYLINPIFSQDIKSKPDTEQKNIDSANKLNTNHNKKTEVKKDKKIYNFLDLSRDYNNEFIFPPVLVPLYLQPNMSYQPNARPMSLIIFNKLLDYYDLLNPDKKEKPFLIVITSGLGFDSEAYGFRFEDLFQFNYSIVFNNIKPSVLEFTLGVNGNLSSSNESDYTYKAVNDDGKNVVVDVQTRKTSSNYTRGFSSLDYNKFWLDFTMFWFITVENRHQTEINNFKTYKWYRSQWGYGLKYDLYEGEFISDLDISFAPLMEYTNTRSRAITPKGKVPASEIKVEDKIYRGSFRLRIKMNSIDNKVKFKIETWYKPNLESQKLLRDDWYLDNTVEATFVITETLSYISRLNLYYTSKPTDPSFPHYRMSFVSNLSFRLNFNIVDRK